MVSGVEHSRLSAGRRLGRYEICAELAAGGMATVYLARATGPAGFDKLVALKVVHPRLARERDFIEMFQDEARIASRITHANVGSVFDIGEESGTHYLAMDYLHGEALSSVLGCVATRPEVRASQLYPVHVMAIMAAACEGLHAAHELRGDDGSPLDVVHRDVSPHNIFVTYDGGVRVVDFGIARAAGRLHKTLSGTIKGKVAYMPPEQLRGDALDRRADIWAVGVTLWELLTCRRLFRRESQGKTIDAVLTDFIPPPSTFAPNLPAGVDDIVASALSRDPRERPTSARELGRSLRRAMATTGEVVGMAELSEWMEVLFAEHRQAKQAMIDQARRGGVVRDVPDTQRFARIPADLVPTAVDERSDVRAKARAGMDTLRDGGFGTVPRASVGEGDAIDQPEPHGQTAGTAAPEAPVQTPTPPRAPLRTEPVVLPVHTSARRLPLLFGLLLVLAAAGAIGLFLAAGNDGSPAIPDAALPPASTTTTAAPSVEPETTLDAHVEDAPSQAGPEPTPRPDPEATPRSTMRPTMTSSAEERAEPPPSGPGRLSIGVRGGWGTYVVDGSERGDTPAELTLPAGRHRVVIRPFGEGPPITRSVTIRPGETTRVAVDAP